ncbi:MAG: hypothetical protein ACFFD4_11935 [Candidatus Odinarchaeota archaeon]
MSRPDVIFSVFDQRLGPIPVFSTRKDEEFILKIAFKSQLTLSMLDSATQKIETAEAVLPFPDIGKIAYIFLFGVKSIEGTHTECVASLSYTEDITEQMNLYRKIPLLKKQAINISKVLALEYEYGGRGQKLSKKLEVLINSYGDSLDDEMDHIETEYADKKIRIRDSKEGSVDFLLKTVKKGLDGVIYSLVVEKPIIVFGHHAEVPLVVGSLELLVPFKILRKIDYTMTYVDPRDADIIGMDERLVKYYSVKDNHITLINVKKGKAEGPFKSKYISNFIKELQKVDEQQARLLIEREISKALSSANKLIEICNVANPSREEISGFKKNIEPDVMELILAIATNYNPVIADHVKSEVSQAFTDWLDGL